MTFDFNSIESYLPVMEAYAEQAVTEVPSSQSLDPEKYSAYAKAPSDIDEETLMQLVNIIDGRLNVDPSTNEAYESTMMKPSTIDQVVNSEAVIYITEDDIPVGVVTLVNPEERNYRGIIPLRLYSMYSGMNLNGRLMQEFFSVADEYHGLGIGQELRAQVANLGIKTFTVVPTFDKSALNGMAKNGYQYVCTVDIDNGAYPETLWID